jgi:hypothetical protein
VVRDVRLDLGPRGASPQWLDWRFDERDKGPAGGQSSHGRPYDERARVGVVLVGGEGGYAARTRSNHSPNGAAARSFSSRRSPPIRVLSGIQEGWDRHPATVTDTAACDNTAWGLLVPPLTPLVLSLATRRVLETRQQGGRRDHHRRYIDQPRRLPFRAWAGASHDRLGVADTHSNRPKERSKMRRGARRGGTVK